MADEAIIEDFKKKEAEKKLVDETVAKVEKESSKDNVEKQAAGMETTRIQSLEKREKDVKDLEARVDNKIADYKKLISEAEKHGESLAGDAIVRSKTKEEEITANAKKMLAGTGMEDRI